jgi:hypothetical protein
LRSKIVHWAHTDACPNVIGRSARAAVKATEIPSIVDLVRVNSDAISSSYLYTVGIYRSFARRNGTIRDLSLDSMNEPRMLTKLF